MKVHWLLLQRHSGKGEVRRHDSRVGVARPNTAWCFEALDISCVMMRVAVVTYCDKEALGHITLTASPPRASAT
ncbi:hypothetical protein ACH0BU_17540 [Sphingomonas olei]